MLRRDCAYSLQQTVCIANPDDRLIDVTEEVVVTAKDLGAALALPTRGVSQLTQTTC